MVDIVMVSQCLEVHPTTDITSVGLARSQFFMSPVPLGREKIEPAEFTLKPLLHPVLQVHVTLQTSVGGELLPTGGTVFQSNLGVDDVFVVLQTFPRPEGFLTVGTHKWFLS